MLKNVFISDQFNTWNNCKRKYYFKYVKMLNFPESESNFNLGKSVHAIINYYLKGFEVENLIENVDENIKDCWNVIKEHPILKNKSIVTEWTFNARVGDSKHWLNGRIDAVFSDGNGKYIIADWKTGQNIPKNPDTSFQCMMYLYSFFNAQNDLKINFSAEDLCFQYIKISKDDVKVYSIDYSKEKAKLFEKIFLKTISDIESEKEFKSNINCNDKHCPYQRLCNGY